MWRFKFVLIRFSHPVISIFLFHLTTIWMVSRTVNCNFTLIPRRSNATVFQYTLSHPKILSTITIEKREEIYCKSSLRYCFEFTQDRINENLWMRKWFLHSTLWNDHQLDACLVLNSWSCTNLLKFARQKLTICHGK